MKNKPTIILAAHGSRETPALETFQRFDAAIQQAFPNHPVIWTFAGYILKKLRTESTDEWVNKIYTADELKALNLPAAVLQSLIIIPSPLHTKALLSTSAQIDQVAAILEKEMTDPETAYILCGHGSKKRPEQNQPLIDLHKKLQRENVFLATLDGPPGNQETLEAVRAENLSKARFIPVMFASGMHVRQDIMGDAPESWKSKLILPATVAPPLGDNPQVIDLFISRIRDLLK